MRSLKTFLIAGVIVPVALHVLSPDKMPWWPDTASLAIGFSIVALLTVSRYEEDRDLNRRFGRAVARFARRVLPTVTYQPAPPSKRVLPPASTRPEAQSQKPDA